MAGFTTSPWTSRLRWVPTVVLGVLVVLVAAVLVRLLTAPAGGTGAVDGTTPAVAGARVESGALKQSAIDAATEQGGEDGAEVVDAGIISVTSADATVLLFVDAPATGEEEVSLTRVVVTLRRDGAGWRLTGRRPV